MSSKKLTHAHLELHQHTQTGGLVAEFVYGASDGIVTTFAVVASVAGAGLNPLIVIVLGIANLLADGFSMASSSYLSTQSEYGYEDRERATEEMEIEKWPEEEREEIREIYRKKGFEGKLLDQVVEKITSDKKLWVDEMLVHEHGIITDNRIAPFKNAAATFVAFIVAGIVPLIPYLISQGEQVFMYSIILAAITFFTVGAFASRVTAHSWWGSGLQMLIVGTLAGAVAYGVGYAVKAVFGIVI